MGQDRGQLRPFPITSITAVICEDSEDLREEKTACQAPVRRDRSVMDTSRTERRPGGWIEAYFAAGQAPLLASRTPAVSSSHSLA